MRANTVTVHCKCATCGKWFERKYSKAHLYREAFCDKTCQLAKPKAPLDKEKYKARQRRWRDTHPETLEFYRAKETISKVSGIPWRLVPKELVEAKVTLKKLKGIL